MRRIFCECLHSFEMYLMLAFLEVVFVNFSVERIYDDDDEM